MILDIICQHHNTPRENESEDTNNDSKQFTNALGNNLKFDEAHPTCAACEASMDLIIQIADKSVVEKPVMIFQCQNDPGMCGDWEADSGANKVIFTDSVQAIPCDLSLTFVESNYTDDEYENDEVTLNENVIGKVFGRPIWIQADETPDCCQKPMQFILQINDADTLNFGDCGTGYLFKCTHCSNGKFMWQCL